MNCYYCDQITETEPDYVRSEASHDLGSEAPRCLKHWRYNCGNCGKPSHFMATGYCDAKQDFFCSACAAETDEVVDSFWAWKYYFRYRSPWSRQWVVALDRLEFEGQHPLQQADPGQPVSSAISAEEYLVRYPMTGLQTRPNEQVTNADVRANWNRNAVKWDAGYDDDGDRNRRYQSDEPMLGMLGNVEGLRILDVGSGNGYLCRKLARAGAEMTGVELSDEFQSIATARESRERLGITYHNVSATEVDFLPDAYFDKAVSNYVLMDILDYSDALRQVFRVLKPGGLFVAVISHPCFAGGPAGWVKPALDSPRTEDRFAWRSDLYFHRGAYIGQWGNLDPVLSFHRPLRDYWQEFESTGFVVNGFDEPSITERGRRELSPARIAQTLRVPYSCIFRLLKPV